MASPSSLPGMRTSLAGGSAGKRAGCPSPRAGHRGLALTRKPFAGTDPRRRNVREEFDGKEPPRRDAREGGVDSRVEVAGTNGTDDPG